MNPLKSITQPGSITVDLDYSYTGSGSNRSFTGINNISSHSLINFPVGWNQTTYSYNIYNNNNTVNVTLHGYNVIGINVGGQSIGANINDTINFDYDINTSGDAITANRN